MKKQNIGRCVKSELVLLAVILSMTCGCAKEQETDSLFGLLTEETTDTGAGTKEESPDAYISDAQEDMMPLENETVFVHICGEVVCPGVYEVAADSRIYDVLMLAGGFTEEASEDYLNLAMPVKDGMQIRILSEEEAEAERNRLANQALGLININTASVADLCTLPGIGESRAKDIIAYRIDNGAFLTPEEIMQVSGIKDAMYEKIKDKICVE